MRDQVDEVEYWVGVSLEERISAVEVLRRRMYGGNDGVRPRLSEFVALLARHDVRYMIVGSYALAAQACQGRPVTSTRGSGRTPPTRTGSWSRSKSSALAVSVSRMTT